MKKAAHTPQNSDPYENLVKRIRELEAALATSKEGQQALALDNFNLFALIDRIPDPIYFKDRESRFIRVNQAWAQKHGLGAPSLAIAKSDFDFFEPEFAEQTMRDEQKIIQTGEIVSVIEKFVANGEEAWYSSIKVPVRNSDNTIIGTCGISRDITAVKRAERILEQTNTLLERRVMEKTGDLLSTNHSLEERIQQLDFLNKVSFDFSQKITVQETSLAILSAFCEYFASTEGALCLFENNLCTVRHIMSVSNGAGEKLWEMLAARYDQNGLREMQLKPLRDCSPQSVAPPFTNRAIEYALFIPLWTDENNVGTVILAVDRLHAEYSKKENSLLRIMASISGLSLKKALQNSASEEKARYEGELIAARNIQQMLIPKTASLFPHVGVECAYRPASEVGGDYLDYFTNDLGHLVIAIGDVCGKGVPAALLMSILRTTLRIHANAQTSAVQLVVDVHKSMKANLTFASFITLLCCIINRDGTMMSYARAGHQPMLRLKSGSGLPESLGAEGIALGMENSTAAFSTLMKEKLIPLSKGDRFFIYTDGIIEAILPDGSLFGTERLKQKLGAIATPDRGSIITGIIGTLTDPANGILVNDDVAALSFDIL
jgi:PAS domain S-box-containing protein